MMKRSRIFSQRFLFSGIRVPFFWTTRSLRHAYFTPYLTSRTFFSSSFSLTSAPTSSPATLLSRLAADLKTAMVAKDKKRVSAIRLIRNEFTNREKEKGVTLTQDSDLIPILIDMAKECEENAQEFDRVGRPDKSAEERFEKSVIQSYLPNILSKEEIIASSLEILRRLGIPKGEGKLSEMGKVLSALKEKHGGSLVSPKEVGAIIREILEKKK